MQKWQSALRFIGLGWFVAACILLGGLGGKWLDSRIGTSPVFTIIGIMAGTGIAFYGVYRMLASSLDDTNKRGKD